MVTFNVGITTPTGIQGTATLSGVVWKWYPPTPRIYTFTLTGGAGGGGWGAGGGGQGGRSAQLTVTYNVTDITVPFYIVVGGGGKRNPSNLGGGAGGGGGATYVFTYSGSLNDWAVAGGGGGGGYNINNGQDALITPVNTLSSSVQRTWIQSSSFSGHQVYQFGDTREFYIIDGLDSQQTGSDAGTSGVNGAYPGASAYAISPTSSFAGGSGFPGGNVVTPPEYSFGYPGGNGGIGGGGGGAWAGGGGGGGVTGGAGGSNLLPSLGGTSGCSSKFTQTSLTNPGSVTLPRTDGFDGSVVIT